MKIDTLASFHCDWYGYNWLGFHRLWSGKIFWCSNLSFCALTDAIDLRLCLTDQSFKLNTGSYLLGGDDLIEDFEWFQEAVGLTILSECLIEATDVLYKKHCCDFIEKGYPFSSFSSLTTNIQDFKVYVASSRSIWCFKFGLSYWCCHDSAPQNILFTGDVIWLTDEGNSFKKAEKETWIHKHLKAINFITHSDWKLYQ